MALTTERVSLRWERWWMREVEAGLEVVAELSWLLATLVAVAAARVWTPWWLMDAVVMLLTKYKKVIARSNEVDVVGKVRYWTNRLT